MSAREHLEHLILMADAGEEVSIDADYLRELNELMKDWAVMTKGIYGLEVMSNRAKQAGYDAKKLT